MLVLAQEQAGLKTGEHHDIPLQSMDAVQLS